MTLNQNQMILSLSVLCKVRFIKKVDYHPMQPSASSFDHLCLYCSRLHLFQSIIWRFFHDLHGNIGKYQEYLNLSFLRLKKKLENKKSIENESKMFNHADNCSALLPSWSRLFISAPRVKSSSVVVSLSKQQRINSAY